MATAKRNPSFALDLAAKYRNELENAVAPDRKAANANYIISAVDSGMESLVDVRDPEMIMYRTEKYLQNCADRGIKPHMPGYALALGMSLQTFNSLFSDKTIPAASINALDKGRAMVETIFVSNILDQRIHPTSGIFLSKNWFGYRDESDVNVHRHEQESVDTKTIEDRYKSIVGSGEIIDVDVIDNKAVENGKE